MKLTSKTSLCYWLSRSEFKEAGSSSAVQEFGQQGRSDEFPVPVRQPKSKLQTDGAGIYRGINNWWQVVHKRDIHRKWEFGLTSEIEEGMFGNLRTFIRRMYHHVTPEYLPEYVSEFCVRFSSPEIFYSPLTYLEKSI